MEFLMFSYEILANCLFLLVQRNTKLLTNFFYVLNNNIPDEISL